jgi:hypothetical protein
MNVRVVVLDGKHAGRQMKLPATQFVIGRDPSCHLRPTSSDVSRFHCAIATYSGQPHVRDLKSRNGTFVNERRISGAVRLHRGDVLRIGPLRFRIVIESLEPSPHVAKSADNDLGWLVRSPDESESAALDPSMPTMVGTVPWATVAAGVSPVRAWRLDPAHEDAGAVAGDFLREYLHRRNASPD